MSAVTYKTIAALSKAQHRVLGSRHMAYAFPVQSEKQIKQHIDNLWKEHHSATHVCYAWRLGWDKKHYRANDDGEPSGTAGKPIYGQIQSFDLTNILIAVVRYYGGTKLGTGGLIDAYRTASRLSLATAEIVEMEIRGHHRIICSHEQMPRIMKALKEMKMEKLDSMMSDLCEIEFFISKKYEPQLHELLRNSPDIKLENIDWV
ncbi:MAG: IMPACT family protein [Flavobacteriales bacterium]